jgi:hypothetical protein
MGLEKWLTSSVLPPTHPSSDACLEGPHGPAQSLPHSSGFTVSFTLHLLQPRMYLSESQLITSALKMEAARFSETLAPTNQSTRCLYPKERHPISNLRNEILGRSVHFADHVAWNLAPFARYPHFLSYLQWSSSDCVVFLWDAMWWPPSVYMSLDPNFVFACALFQRARTSQKTFKYYNT